MVTCEDSFQLMIGPNYSYSGDFRKLHETDISVHTNGCPLVKDKCLVMFASCYLVVWERLKWNLLISFALSSHGQLSSKLRCRD